MIQDPVRATVQRGGLVIWEEAARDGAQGKTIMDGPTRVALARRTGALFGANGPGNVIFGAGFPSIGYQEIEVMRQLAAEVDNCSLASHGRPSNDEIDLAVKALEGAAYPRITFFIAVSAAMTNAMRLGSPSDALARGLDILDYALNKGGGIPIDVTLADASRADPEFCTDAVAALDEAGATIVKACDSMGVFRPEQAHEYFSTMLGRLPGGAVLGTHQHNDYGLALANNLAAIRAGVRVLATSWLGLGERNGLAPTEQLLFALTQGTDGDGLWTEAPDISQLAPIAREVSRVTGVPIKVTDAVIGTGVNTLSTGTPFIDKSVFRPFDPAIVGLVDEVLVTQMINGKVVEAVLAQEGIALERAQTKAAVRWVKDKAYTEQRAVIDRGEFVDYVRDVLLNAAAS